MANTAAVTIHVQFSDGTTRAGLSVTVGGNSASTNSRGEVTFTGLKPREMYKASHKGDSVSFTAGQSPIVLSIR